MTLLEDLQSIDLSGIIDARATIRLSVEGDDVQAIISGGAAQTALAGLGQSLQVVYDGIDEPSTLIRPVVDAVAGLSGNFDLDGVPLADFLTAVSEGATLISGLFAGIDGDPADFGQNFGFSFNALFEATRSVVERYDWVDLDELVQFRQLMGRIDQGVPTDPQAFAEMAIDLLLPFPKGNLLALRSGANAIIQGAGSLNLPTSRTAGLIGALNGITIAANSGNALQLQAALGELDRVRAHTIASIGNDLRQIMAQIDRLQIDDLLAPMVAATAGLSTARDGALEFLEDLRLDIAFAREQVDQLDIEVIREVIPRFLLWIEEQARIQIGDPIDAQVLRLKAWIRGLLSHLQLRALRAEISAFIHAAAQAVHDADLDGPAEAVRSMLDELQAVLATDLGAAVQDALAQVEQVINQALDGVISSLESIAAQIDAVAAEAEAILNQAAGALAAFRAAIDQITVSIQAIGVEQASQQVVDTLRDLRETAEALLSIAPLPEGMRPIVEQLIATLENIDFETIFQPVRAAVAELEIPDDVGAGINEVLDSAAEVVQNLIPAELIASIEAEIEAALDVIRDFDPTSLLPDVTGYLDEAASFIEGLDPEAIAAEIRGPYDAILEAIDAIAPRRLLEPVIEAYDELMGNIPTPPAAEVASGAVQAINTAGDAMAQAVAGPISRLAPEGGIQAAEPGAGGESPPPPTDLQDVRPGDIIRMFGILPNKLREALVELDQSAAGDLLRTVDGYCGDLARSLRQLQAALYHVESRLEGAIDEMLIPLAMPQLEAQLAIQANFGAGDIDLDLSLAAVAQAGPGQMRAELARGTAEACGRARHSALQITGATAASLERAAIALENCLLANLGQDLDAFLAALDPEPIAAEFDELIRAVMQKTPELLADLGDELKAAVQRIQALIREYNPGVQLQKFLVVLDVLREEIDLFNPRRLAAELGEVHAAIRQVILAYDPAVFAAEIKETLAAIAAAIRGLDPDSLLGDLSFMDTTLSRIENAVPTQALAGVGTSLNEVGSQLAEIDIAGLLASIEALGPQLIDDFESALEAIRLEIIALLESLRYASGSASVSVSASVEIG